MWGPFIHYVENDDLNNVLAQVEETHDGSKKCKKLMQCFIKNKILTECCITTERHVICRTFFPSFICFTLFVTAPSLFSSVTYNLLVQAVTFRHYQMGKVGEDTG